MAKRKKMKIQVTFEYAVEYEEDHKDSLKSLKDTMSKPGLIGVKGWYYEAKVLKSKTKLKEIYEMQENRMKKITTNRGFDLYEFTDRYGISCSLQKSSIATEDCIWLGVDKSEPRIMVSQAEKYGIQVSEERKAQGGGYISYPVPKDVLMNTRMHLSQEQVKELLPILQKFVETGEIDEKNSTG